MKRISGNYFDHLWSIIINIMLFGFIILFFIGIDLDLIIIAFLFTILIAWSAVSLKIFITGKVNSSLYYDPDKGQLKFNDVSVRSNQVDSISIDSYNAYQYDYIYIDFVVLENELKHQFRIQNKVSLFLFDSNSKYPKSLSLLFDYIPELKLKLKSNHR